MLNNSFAYAPAIAAGAAVLIIAGWNAYEFRRLAAMPAEDWEAQLRALIAQENDKRVQDARLERDRVRGA